MFLSTHFSNYTHNEFEQLLASMPRNQKSFGSLGVIMVTLKSKASRDCVANKRSPSPVGKATFRSSHPST